MGNKLFLLKLETTEYNVNDVVLAILLSTLNTFHTFISSVYIVEFEQVNVSWDDISIFSINVVIHQNCRLAFSFVPYITGKVDIFESVSLGPSYST